MQKSGRADKLFYFPPLALIWFDLICFFFLWRQDAEGLPVEVKVKSKGDGVYACSYTPASPLKHTLAITWGGVSIPKSPFRVSGQSQLAVQTRSFVLSSKSKNQTKVMEVSRSEDVFKAESVQVVESEQTHLTQTTYNIESQKSKKPLIVIITYTEEKLE